MKKLFIVLAFLTIGGSIATAQSVKFGVKFGFNRSTLTWYEEPYGDLGPRYAMHVGGVVEFMLTDRIGIQPEVLYLAQGESERKEGFKRLASINYISFPVAFKYFIWDGVSVDFVPYFSILSSAKYKTEINGEKTTTNIESLLQPNDHGFGIGVTGQDQGLIMGLRLNLGLKNTLKGSTEKIGNKNVALLLSLGYLF